MTDWHIVGLGSMGTLAAYYLQRAGFTVHALHPAHHVTLSRTLVTPTGACHNLTVSNQFHQHTPIHRLVVATKTTDTVTALSPLLTRLTPNCTLIRLQNGMGSLSGLALPAATRRLEASTTNGAWRDGDRVHLVAENQTFLGTSEDDQSGVSGVPAHQHPDWLDTLRPHWPGLAWRTDMPFLLLCKLAVNAVINPLTAFYHCRNGALFDHPRYTLEATRLAAEVDHILAACHPGWPGDTLTRARQVANATADNQSSMLRDIQSGRPTEIDFINGQLIRMAEQAGLACPENRYWVNTLHTLSDTGA